MPEEKKKILITIDVEDWFQVENLRPYFPASTWNGQVCRVADNTKRLLDLFASFDHPVRATFFVLGWIARRFPDLVKRIQANGHEIASHGDNHELNNQMEFERLWTDLQSSKKLLEDISGTAVNGYRAPSFSISDQIIETVQQCGYKYDSSYNSFDKHGRYGRLTLAGRASKGVAIKYDQQFHELPVSNLKIFNHVIPWGGGGYFRLIPTPIFQLGIRRILKTQDAYIFYMHPWEIDPGQPRPESATGFPAWRHYLNLDKTYTRLHALISRFSDCEFTTCSQYLSSFNR